MMTDATARIDVLVFSGTFYAQAQPRVASMLAAAAERGAEVRLCFGDPASDAVATRDREEGTGIRTEITGILGVYSDPGHIVAYTDGEIRQEWELILLGRPVSGALAANDEASDVRWVAPSDLQALNIHPTQRRQLHDWLDHRDPHID